jgi:hypothetical protein
MYQVSDLESRMPNRLSRLLLMCALLPIWALAAENLVVNGDFEQIDGDLPAGWLSYAAPGDGPYFTRDGGFTAGRVSLRLKSTLDEATPGGKSSAIIADRPLADLQPGREYRLSFWAKSPRAGQPLQAYLYTGADTKPHWYKMKPFIVTGNWSRYTFVQAIPEAAEWQNRGLRVRFDIPWGEVLLDDVAMEENKAAEVPVAAQAPSQKNLMCNPGFELGWMGWGAENSVPAEQLSGKTDGRRPTFDPAEKQHGAVSLKLPPRQGLRSLRMPLVPGQKYTLSFWAKCGEAEGPSPRLTVFLITPTWKLAQLSLDKGKDLGEAWKRYSLSLTVPTQGSAYRNTFYARIDVGDLHVWLDSFQLEKGDLTAYDSGLQMGIDHRQPLGLFPVGKESPVEAVVWANGGLKSPGVFTLTAKDVAARLLWQTNFILAASANERQAFPFSYPARILGVHEVALEARAQAGGPLLAKGTWRGVVVEGDASSVKLNPLIGIENPPRGLPDWADADQEAIANAAGIGYTRFFTWADKSGDGLTEATLEVIKKKTAAKKASGKTVMVCVEPPKDCALLPNEWNKVNVFDEEIPESKVDEEVARFGAFAARHAVALGRLVDVYQLLNEPNIWRAREGKKKGMTLMPAERYLRFLASGSAAIRKALPGAKIAANINGIDAAYTERLFSLGVARHIDVFTIHSYRAAPETPPTYEDLRRLRGLIDRFAPGLPIVNDEQYFGEREQFVGRGLEDDRDYFSDTEHELTGRVLQNFLHHLAADRVPYVMFSPAAQFAQVGMGNPMFPYHTWGAVRHLSQLFLDLKEGTNLDLHPSLRCFLFERRDGTRIVSLNTRQFGMNGILRRPACDGAVDQNGNAFTGGDVSLGFLPSYLIFKPGLAREELLGRLRRMDILGLDAPLRAKFSTEKGTLVVEVENADTKPLDTSIQFLRVPAGWKIEGPLAVKSLASRATARFTFPIPETTLAWDRAYDLEWRAAAGDRVVAQTVKLPNIQAPYGERRIDGELEDWKSAPWMAMGDAQASADFSGGKQTRRGDDDISAKAAIAWDREHIHLAVEVRDDVAFFGEGNEGHFWMHDSLQVYFDLGNDGGKAYDGNDVAYSIGQNRQGQMVAWLDKNPTGRYVGAANADKGIDNDVVVMFKRIAGGWRMELAFPRQTLPTLDYKAGSVFGFSLLINDNDGTGRKQGVTLGPKGTEPHGKPALWRTVRLAP